MQRAYCFDIGIASADARADIISIISVKLAAPQFDGQTKNKLSNPEIAGAVAQCFQERLHKSPESNPSDAKAVIPPAHDSLTARKNAIDGFSLPGKLSDCAEPDPFKSDLYIVAGEILNAEQYLA